MYYMFSLRQDRNPCEECPDEQYDTYQSYIDIRRLPSQCLPIPVQCRETSRGSRSYCSISSQCLPIPVQCREPNKHHGNPDHNPKRRSTNQVGDTGPRSAVRHTAPPLCVYLIFPPRVSLPRRFRRSFFAGSCSAADLRAQGKSRA